MGKLLLLLAACLLPIGCSDSTPSSATNVPSGDAGACAEDQDCALCCNTANKDENHIAVGYVIQECACKDKKAPCSAQCQPLGNDICADPEATPTEVCITCIEDALKDSSSACVGAASTTCSDDAKCSPLLDCLRGCP